VYEAVLDRLAGDPSSFAVVIPRTEAQALSLERRASGSSSPQNLLVPDRAIDAQSLIAFADIVVSAGGTMNREAVALGTPAYTIFSGRMGAVDERLIATGRLRVLSDPSGLELRKREAKQGVGEPRDPQLLVDGVLQAVG
jgi:predicted glycosyltransferase